VDKPSVEENVQNLNSDFDGGQTVCGIERTKVKQKMQTVDKPSVEQSVRKLNSDCEVGKASVVCILHKVIHSCQARNNPVAFNCDIMP